MYPPSSASAQPGVVPEHLRKERATRQRSTASDPGKPDLNAQLAPLATNAGLDPYTGTLDVASARHLLRRTAFGADKVGVDAIVGRSASEVVDEIVNAAAGWQAPTPPSWINHPPPGPNATDAEWQAYNDLVFEWLDQLRVDWMQLMIDRGLREKLTLFWLDHFVTNQETYYHTQFGYRYLALLREHALGNFKDFTHAVGLAPAMLIYLNGVDNEESAPNENYARELLELFTCGIVDKNNQPNYSEDDIQNIARCLTGWQINWSNFTSWHNSNRFDNGQKSFFGQTGNYGYDDVVDIVFQERAAETAWYICSKLYQEFVYEAPAPDVVDAMASLLLATNWNIEPVVRALLKSEHFFDAVVHGAKIASPVELSLRFLKEIGGYNSTHLWMIFWTSWGLEQVLMNIPSVNGWPRHRNWVSTQSIAERWNALGWLIWSDETTAPLDFVGLLESLVDTTDPHLAFRVGPALVEHLVGVPISELDIETVSRDFAGDLTNNPIPDFVVNGPAYMTNLAKLLLDWVPWYEWSPYNEQLGYLLRNFVMYITRLPEYNAT